MIKIDMHVHSDHSFDGVMSVDKILQNARKKGLDGVAIADHDNFGGTLEALGKDTDLIIIPAAEFSTEYGHMLCYFMTDDPADAGLKKENGKYRFAELRQFITEKGGLLFAAHPYRGQDFPGDILRRVDGVEMLNGRNTALHHKANIQARDTIVRRTLPFSAGSDAHTVAELGSCCREFDLPKDATLEEIRAELMKHHGRCFGRYAPLSMQGCSGMVGAAKKRHAKRFIKYLAKFIAGLFLDATKNIRPGSKALAKGICEEINLEG
ncbi:MAG: PHP domain-containing protein [Oscillospiraceae bacterium]|nr:PHP domain-containing protein [Oscillospiraceae bacterium]